jgi:hypothetical protein
MAFTANQLTGRLVIAGLTHSEAKQVTAEVEGWIKHSGSEWTVQHLKLIKQTIVSLWADYPMGVSPYVKTRNGVLTGPFRAIQRLLIRGRKRALAALLQYTSYIAHDLSKAQARKFKESVNCTEPDVWYEWEPNIFEGLKIPTLLSHQTCFEESWDHWSPTKFAPGHGGKSVSEADTRVQLDCFLKTQFYRHVYYCTDFIGSEDNDYFLSSVLRYVHEKPRGKEPVGKISVIQEPGFKARFIANPNRVVQWALQPLGDFLFNLLRALPWDCTFDQRKADVQIKGVLKGNGAAASILEKEKAKLKSLEALYSAGKNVTTLGKITTCKSLIEKAEAATQKVYCFDLSNATDRFPLGIQTSLMVSLGEVLPDVQRELLYSQMRLFELAARSHWSFEGETLQWQRGQPLGLYPSFPLFALAHGLLLRSLYFQAHEAWPVFGDDVLSPFYVLGDDVIIFDDWLASAYVQALKEYEIPFSLGKSILSYKAAEFCGYLYSAQTTYIPTKWRCVSESSFVEFLKVWGVEGINLLPRHLRDVATVVARLPEPVGLGYNPLGIPLKDRVEEYLDLYVENELCPALSKNVEDADVARILQSFGDLRLIRGVDTYFSKHRTDAKKLCALDFLATKHLLSPKDVKEFLNSLILDDGLSVKEAIRQARLAGYKIRKQSFKECSEREVTKPSLFDKVKDVLQR